jgi:hypothetical protein
MRPHATSVGALRFRAAVTVHTRVARTSQLYVLGADYHLVHTLQLCLELAHGWDFVRSAHVRLDQHV